MQAELAELAHLIELGIEESFAGAEGAYNNALRLMIGVSVVAAVIAVAMGFFLSRSISGGVAAVGKGMQRIAVGDLTALRPFQLMAETTTSKATTVRKPPINLVLMFNFMSCSFS